jgi:hypothetical protein
MSKSSIITDQIPSPSPGDVLLLDFIEPMGLTGAGGWDGRMPRCHITVVGTLSRAGRHGKPA